MQYALQHALPFFIELASLSGHKQNFLIEQISRISVAKLEQIVLSCTFCQVIPSIMFMISAPASPVGPANSRFLTIHPSSWRPGKLLEKSLFSVNTHGFHESNCHGPGNKANTVPTPIFTKLVSQVIFNILVVCCAVEQIHMCWGQRRRFENKTWMSSLA